MMRLNSFWSFVAVPIAAALCQLAAPPVLAADASGRADVASGEHIARILCSACHVVARDQEFPPILNQPGPNFSEIASRPGTTAATLQHFVLNTHWDVNKVPMTMPNPMLTQDQARQVARYIMSLRNH